MLNVNEGLTVEGERVSGGEDDFDSLLAKQVGRAAEPKAQGDVTERVDPSADTTETIYRQVLADTPTTNLEAGLTVGRPEAPVDRERLLAEARRATAGPEFDRLRAERAAATEVASRSQNAERELALRDFVGVRNSAESDEELVTAAIRLRGASPQGYADMVAALDEEDLALYDGGGFDDDELPADDELAGTVLDAEVRDRWETARRVLESEAAATRAQQTERANFNQTVQLLKEWMQEQRVPAELVNERFDAAALDVFATTGTSLFDIARIDPEAAVNNLRVADAARRENEQLARTEAFHRQLVGNDASLPNVSDGLKVNGVSMQEGLDDLPPHLRAKVKFDPERVARRADRSTTVGEFRREIASAHDSTDVASGFTQNGKPVSPDEASGAKRRHEEQLREERARSIEFLPGNRT